MCYNLNMSNNYTHNCIKCGSKYTDDDVDAYYCTDCIEVKKRIAKEVDKKIMSLPKRHNQKSDLQIYDEMCRARGTAFVPIKDMGIKL